MSPTTPVISTLRALLVEDDAGVAQIVLDGLSRRGWSIHRCATIDAARRALSAEKFDAVILDITLPDGSGLDLADSVRGRGDTIPMLMLTARDTVHERVEGFRRGADDYLCKPFDIEELAARLGAIVRRTRTKERTRLAYADIELDLITRIVKRGDTTATLSTREAELLAYFMRHPDEPLARERVLEQVWGDEAEDDSNVLNVYVNYLRNKIEAAVHPRVIHTVRGMGYIFSSQDPQGQD